MKLLVFNKIKILIVKMYLAFYQYHRFRTVKNSVNVSKLKNFAKYFLKIKKNGKVFSKFFFIKRCVGVKFLDENIKLKKLKMKMSRS